MADVRGKFRLNSFTTELHTRTQKGYPVKRENGTTDYGTPESVEKRTLNFTPVYSDKEGSENKAFWDSSPSGSIQLGVVNPEAWKHFAIGKEYYVDFTAAE